MIKPMSEEEIDELWDESKKQETQTGSDVDEQQPQENTVVVELHPLTKEDQTKKNKNIIYNDMDKNNPYRNKSKVNLSTGMTDFRWIETEVLKTLMKSSLNGSEWSVLFYIIHRTRGYCDTNKFYKQTEDISVEEIQEYTDLSIPTIYKTLKSLVSKKMVYEVKKGRSYRIGVNFRYDTWDIN